MRWMQQASHSLANLAIRSGSSDNVSVVIVLFHAASGLVAESHRRQDVDHATSEDEHTGHCMSCGHQNPTAYEFCANCGQLLP